MLQAGRMTSVLITRVHTLGGLGKIEKKGSLLFDYACHPCTGTMLIFSVYLSVLLMPRSRSPGPLSKLKLNIYKGNVFSGPSPSHTKKHVHFHVLIFKSNYYQIKICYTISDSYYIIDVSP